MQTSGRSIGRILEGDPRWYVRMCSLKLFHQKSHKIEALGQKYPLYM